MERELSRLCGLAIALTGIVFSGIWVAIAVQAVRAAFLPEDPDHPFLRPRSPKSSDP